MITHLENAEEYEAIREMLSFVWKITNKPYIGTTTDLEMHKFLKPYNGRLETKLRQCFKDKFTLAQKTLTECKKNTRAIEGFS